MTTTSKVARGPAGADLAGGGVFPRRFAPGRHTTASKIGLGPRATIPGRWSLHSPTDVGGVIGVGGVASDVTRRQLNQQLLTKVANAQSGKYLQGTTPWFTAQNPHAGNEFLGVAPRQHNHGCTGNHTIPNMSYLESLQVFSLCSLA